jgi:hypothetical protein
MTNSLLLETLNFNQDKQLQSQCKNLKQQEKNMNSLLQQILNYE